MQPGDQLCINSNHFPFLYQEECLAADLSEPFNKHDYLDLYYLVSGRASLVTKVKTLPLEDHDLFLVNSYVPHQLLIDAESHYIQLMIPFAVINSNFDSPLNLTITLNTASHPEQKETAYYRSIVEYMLRISDIMHDIQGGTSYISANLLLYSILMELHQNCVKPKSYDTQERLGSLRANKVLEYIRSHYMEPITLTSAAELVNLEPHYFSKVFKETFGESFSSYLLGVRLVHAMSDLEHTRLPVVEIALRNGFPSPKSFNQALQKAYSTTPSEHRRNYIDNPHLLVKRIVKP